MIAKHYKKGTRMGLERGKKGFGRGSRMGLERGKNGVGTGAKTGFKSYKKWNLARFNNLEWLFFAVPHLFSLFFAVPPLFSPVFDDFCQKGEKRVSKNGGTGKEEKRSSQFLSRSHFFPFLSKKSLPATVGSILF